MAKVVQSGTPPAVNGLIVIAHSGEFCPLIFGVAHQVFEQLVLGNIGVLVFIHQEVIDLFVPALCDIRKASHQLQRQAQKIIKINALVCTQAVLVLGHDERNLSFLIV